MTQASTTIRVSAAQRDRLRKLAEDDNATMTDTLDAALAALRRERFYEAMSVAEERLRSQPEAWESYRKERDHWLHTEPEGP